ncbi:hypothetical protein [Companilactobacillus jidongensis]|uniref:hypothetical protein n=1 Tax=Companilactobacillus jidongensis TaxID=2486006 RepID=UPI000F7AD212|nr:hypothetical protein [Companilactobacillus jidongensis]
MISKKIRDEILYKNDIEPYGVEMAKQNLVVDLDAVEDTKYKFSLMRNRLEHLQRENDIYYPSADITERVDAVNSLMDELDDLITFDINRLHNSNSEVSA